MRLTYCIRLRYASHHASAGRTATIRILRLFANYNQKLYPCEIYYIQTMVRRSRWLFILFILLLERSEASEAIASKANRYRLLGRLNSDKIPEYRLSSCEAIATYSHSWG